MSHIEVEHNEPRVKIAVNVDLDIDDLTSSFDDVREILDIVDEIAMSGAAAIAEVIEKWKDGGSGSAPVPVAPPEPPAPNLDSLATPVVIAESLPEALERFRHPSNAGTSGTSRPTGPYPPIVEPPRVYVTPVKPPAERPTVRFENVVIPFTKTNFDPDRARVAAGTGL